MKSNSANILEWGWLIAACLGLAATLHSIGKQSLQNTLIMAGITVFCFLMYLLRRNLRKKQLTK